jgi:predicted Zn-ribbon and HTH transcriptional regulator
MEMTIEEKLEVLRTRLNWVESQLFQKEIIKPQPRPITPTVRQRARVRMQLMNRSCGRCGNSLNADSICPACNSETGQTTRWKFEKPIPAPPPVQPKPRKKE